jgi:hypothetical protein
MKYRLFAASCCFASIMGFQSAALAEMKISSAGINEGQIDKVHACSNKGGKNQSPQISISGIPGGTSHITIIIDDPDAVSAAGKTWVHWNVFNVRVSGNEYSLGAGEKPSGIIGKNSGGKGYGGMCPPDGRHTYRFAAFATKGDVKVKTSGWKGKAYTIDKFRKDFSASIIESAQTNGDYE